MFNIDQLLNKQFKSYFLKLKLSGEKSLPTRPCITVSRETGSGGRLIAQLVAKSLGFKYYDRKLVELIAKSSNTRKDLIESLDEKSQDFVSQMMSNLLGEKTISASTYFRHLIQVILTLVKKGNCVILGRGANFVVPSQFALNVRVTAPFKIRLAKTMEFERLSEKRARAVMRKKQYERKEFVQRCFSRDVANADYYDLVINTAHLTAEQAVRIVIKAFRTKFPR